MQENNGLAEDRPVEQLLLKQRTHMVGVLVSVKTGYAKAEHSPDLYIKKQLIQTDCVVASKFWAQDVYISILLFQRRNWRFAPSKFEPLSPNLHS